MIRPTRQRASPGFTAWEASRGAIGTSSVGTLEAERLIAAYGGNLVLIRTGLHEQDRELAILDALRQMTDAFGGNIYKCRAALKQKIKNSYNKSSLNHQLPLTGNLQVFSRLIVRHEVNNE